MSALQAACPEWRERIAAAMLGELEPPAATEVAEHLARCAACRTLQRALIAEEPELQAAFVELAAAADQFAAARAHGCAPQPGEQERAPAVVTRAAGGTFPSAASPAHRRRIPMRYTLLMPAAAAAAILVTVAVWPGGGTLSAAYALSDLPRLMQSAIIHTHGEMHPPVPGLEPAPRLDCDFWFDLAGGRSRQPFIFVEGGSERPSMRTGERIVDGQFVLLLDHTAKTAEFSRLNELHRALEAQRTFYALCQSFFGGRDRLASFERSGTETLDGVTYDIWKLETKAAPVGLEYRMACALAPRTGDVGYVRTWIRRGATDWQPYLHLGKWERLNAAPAGTFDTAPPAGYALKNTRESATVPPLDYEGGSGLGNGLQDTKYIAFKLPDGSVLLAWGSRDLESDASQEPLFAGLTFGGPLPRLPLEITALQQELDGRQILCTGRHVAWTRAGDVFHEWSLYVPQAAPAGEKWRTMYEAVHRFNLPAGRVPPEITALVSQPFFVESAADFDRLVLGAMAELAGDHQAPAGISYQRVMELATQVRGTAGGGSAAK